MKIVSVVAKVLAALATAVGAIYLLATYGEQIVAWCKKVIENLPTIEFSNNDEPAAEEAPVAAPAAPVAPVTEDEDEVLDEVPVVEIPVVAPAANEVVADENDFAE